MQDLKIKVNTVEESKEAQELLFELGYEWGAHGKKVSYLDKIVKGEPLCLVAWQIGDISKYVIQIGCGDEYAKEITITELRSMIKPMQEYLNTETYEYKLAHKKPDGDWVCIPAGATHYAEDSNLGIKKQYFFRCPDDAIWVESQWMRASFSVANQNVLWVRPTQPEALPFIDDNPQSLNEQYAEIEQVRQAVKAKSGSDSDHAADAMSYGLMGGIEATLAERQSTYGSFEDVAFVTENIMSVLGRVRVNGLNELPNTHRMALYMIASKMARIVNGDFNHLDGWHDIGGYAKLVEDLIKENNKTY